VSTQQPAAEDGKQRPLVPGSRCLARLSRSVTDTSNDLADINFKKTNDVRL
jgi:hypothetical protein